MRRLHVCFKCLRKKGFTIFFFSISIIDFIHQLLKNSVSIKSFHVNSLSASFTKWSNTLKQFVAKLPTNCLSVFDNFLGLALKRLIIVMLISLACPTVLRKYDFNCRLILNNLPPVDLIPGMDAKILEI